jgi:hypothetical protein
VLSEKNLEVAKIHGNPSFAGVEGKDWKEKGGGVFAIIFGRDGWPPCKALGKGEEGILTGEVLFSLQAIEMAALMEIPLSVKQLC